MTLNWYYAKYTLSLSVSDSPFVLLSAYLNSQSEWFLSLTGCCRFYNLLKWPRSMWQGLSSTTDAHWQPWQWPLAWCQALLVSKLIDMIDQFQWWSWSNINNDVPGTPTWQYQIALSLTYSHSSELWLQIHVIPTLNLRQDGCHKTGWICNSSSTCLEHSTGNWVNW